MLGTSAIVAATLLSFAIPLLAAILPIRQAMKERILEGLDTVRSKVFFGVLFKFTLGACY